MLTFEVEHIEHSNLLRKSTCRRINFCAASLTLSLVTTRMRNFNVITDGLDDESPNNDVKCIYKEVVVVGE
ncbi:hypothetical protein RUM43_002372 [Polyplax serrata]|uniref:Uncharacterized protein n=1 Tax=Polyplax serrata TaxID=468196 RepID=A0AAN8PM97_POLSC